ncbi:hypothetical protein [Litoribacter populi]|uniref:hypothetical protein n=1 Tax=Litoribacter populi TaxID=2598460 RepID=UPI00117EBD55|nr:hypothetical protein [Litoribacter populi]
MKTIAKIDKEHIRGLRFSRREVLDSPESKKFRAADLLRALTLGNLLQSKVNIIFEDREENAYCVETTVWSVGDQFITLKGGIHIPINSIVEVN